MSDYIGARVETIEPNSPASETGLRVGDLVVSVDGQAGALIPTGRGIFQIAEVEAFLHAPAQWSAAHGGVSAFPAS